MELRRFRGHRKRSTRIFWDLYPSVGGLADFILLPSMFFMSNPSFYENPVAILRTPVWFQRDSIFPGFFRDLEDFRIDYGSEYHGQNLVGVISIFLFVKSANDLYLYVFLLTIFELLGQLSMWLPAREFIGKAHFDMAYARVHLKPVILLFYRRSPFPLCHLGSDHAWGSRLYKGCGDLRPNLKTVNILLTLVTSLGSVMLPRVSEPLILRGQKAVNKMHQMSLIYNLVIFPGLPVC